MVVVVVMVSGGVLMLREYSFLSLSTEVVKSLSLHIATTSRYVDK